MPVSFLLQLVPDALVQSRIVGQAKDIETGVTVRLRSSDELLSFLFSCGDRKGTTSGDQASSNDESRPEGDGAPHGWLENPDEASGNFLETLESWQVTSEKRDGRPE